MKSPRFQFSLRLLLSAMLLLGLTLGWLDIRARHNREQRRQVERVWRIGGAVLLDQGTSYELPVFPDEWQLEASKGWLHAALSGCRPIHILFVNHTGITRKTTDDDLPELIDAVREMPTVKRITLTRLFHTEAGAAKVQQAFPNYGVTVLLDNDVVRLPVASGE